ncbi:hypothetical protein [Sphingomonas yabuuchiae]|uniref:hypothetical protein n=1 Tax=Sphingomonas yabuuchiae TaxID=172044 RepID=UPI003D98A3F4
MSSRIFFSSGRWPLIAVLILFALLGLSAALWRHSRSDTGGQAITVVAGTSPEAPAPAAPVTGVSAAPASPGTLPDFDRLSDPERQAIFASHPRDEGWASAKEAALRQRLSGLADGISITGVTCTDRLCVIEGRLAASPARPRDQAVALLKNGPLDHGYGDAGMTKLGLGTINADDSGNLTFTQYIARAD